MTSLELVPWRGAHVPVLQRDEIARYSTTDYINWITAGNGYMGPPMPVTTYGNRPAEPIGNSFLGFVQGMLYADGPVAAAEQYRLRVFGQAPLLYQELTDGRPGDMFDDKNLDLVRAPWPGATLSDLMKRALIFGDFAGNSFGLNLEDEIVLVRPDWVEIILAKRMYRGVQVGWKQVGIMYYEGGIGRGDGAPFLPGEYFHFVPGLPDPLANYRGMSWLTPLIREVQADKSASEHKLAFFENAASPNLAVSLPKEVTPTQFDQFVELMDAKHKGAANAYKTLYTGGGADVTVVGANMQQMDFSAVQGKGETRIANAAGVPPVLLSFSEGMQGSSLNAGNYTAAKRNFVDTTMRDLWMNFAGSIQQMEYFWAPLPKSRLWYDGRDIPFLHEDAADIATRQQTQASALASMVTNGWEPESSKAWLAHDDLQALKHTGAFSVQLQPPGAQDTDGDGQADDFAAPEELQDFDFGALREGVGEAARAKYDIRHGKGTKGGGKFRKLSDVAVPLLKDWLKGKGDGDPLKQFNREQLRTISKDLAKQARDAGDHERASRLTPRRAASEAEIKKALYEDASGKKATSQAGPQEASKPAAQGGSWGVLHEPTGRELTYEDALDAGDRDTAIDATADDFRERRGREPNSAEMVRIERNVDAAIKRRERKQGPAQPAPVEPAPEATPPPVDTTTPAVGPETSDEASADDLVVDRTASPDEVLRREDELKARALAAPPLSLQWLEEHSPNGDQARALAYYQRFGDEHMNGLLRHGEVGAPPDVAPEKLPPPSEVQRSIEVLDGVLAQSRLTEPIVTYRGVSEIARMFPGGDVPGSLVGREFSDQGFTSTSADRWVAEDFMTGEARKIDGALMTVRVPPGIGALQISNDDYKGSGADPSWESEREILLQRGLTYRIVSDEEVPSVYRSPRTGEATTADQPIRHLVVEVVPA